MPRTAGVSCSSVTRPILLSLRPISVARCEWWRRIALPVCSTLIGLKLNKIGRTAELPDTPEVRGMIAKVQHIVRVVGDK